MAAAALALGCSSSSKRTGILYGFDGEPIAQTPVTLLTVDDAGTTDQTLGTTVTDDDGRFEFDLNSQTNASTIVRATVGSAALRGFWSGTDAEIPVHPLTEALCSVIFDVTGTDGGRTTSDFSNAELRDLAGELLDADASGLDLNDSEELADFVRSTLGRKIAIAAGGTFSAIATVDFETAPTVTSAAIDSDPRNVPGDIDENCGFNIYLLSSQDFEFDVLSNGSLCGKTNAGLSPMLVQDSVKLELPEDLFFGFGGTSFPFAANTADIEDEREYVLGPYSLQKRIDPNDPDPMIEEDDVTVTRKIYVPASGNYARYLEIIENEGSEDRSIDLSVQSSLLTSNESQLLAYDGVLGEESRFISAYDANQDRPTVGWLFQDLRGSLELGQLFSPGLAGGAVNEVLYGWGGLIVPAGEKRVFAHFVWLTDSRSSSIVGDRLRSMLDRPDMSGMSMDELSGLVNFSPSEGTITGEAGSVAGWSTVTAAVPNSDRSLTVTANRDGSFAVPLDVSSGENVLLVSSDGLSTFVTVP